MYSFHMGVRAIPITVSPNFALNETYMPSEFGYLDIALRFTANDTGEIISDASVTYSIINYITHSVISSGEIEEVDGLYQASLHMPSTGLYYLNITVEREHYEDFWTAAVLDVRVNMEAQLMNYLFTSFSVLGPLTGLIGAVYLGRRTYKQREFQKYLKLTAIQERFDDARNVIGLIVLHRHSGLPVYSKMLKEGFEKAMVSSFISAISNFRSEISEERLWTAIPLSEVITTVQTNLLICALLTANAPSQSQIQRLESLGRVFGTLFDDEEDTILRISQSSDAARAFSLTFEQSFLQYMDGMLLATYASLDMEKMEDRYKPITQAVSEIDVKEVLTPLELVRTLIASGVDEAKAYILVMEAIENDFILESAEAEVIESSPLEMFSPPSGIYKPDEDSPVSSDHEEKEEEE